MVYKFCGKAQFPHSFGRIADVMIIFVCLLYDLILGFCYNNLTRETGGLERASTTSPLYYKRTD